MDTNRYGNIKQDELQTVLDNNVGDGKTEVIDNDDMLVVKFIESERYYEVDSNGNVTEFELIVDPNPGNIKIGINGETLSGTEESPYEIWCIEDLVEWSNNYPTYASKYINLCTTLNFESSLSYTDSTRTDYGDLNGDRTTEDILTELTKTDDECCGFTPIGSFSGTFNGQGYEIRNIYIFDDSSNHNNFTGFFKLLGGNAYVYNFSITGEILASSTNTRLAGIAGRCATDSSVVIENCCNFCNITGYSLIGGIVAGPYECTIINCCNAGDLNLCADSSGYASVGGIVAGIVDGEYKNDFAGTILNCYNCGNITNNSSKVYAGAGGIIGTTNKLSVDIYNCYNIGQVEGIYSNGAIVGVYWYSNWISTVENCYYLEGSCDYRNWWKLDEQ